MYRKINNLDGEEDTSAIQRIADTAFIPTNSDNIDYQEYLEWVAEGYTPEPALDD